MKTTAILRERERERESRNLNNEEYVGVDAFIDPKKNSAITLIALVITIIVLLILAGITLTFVLGENGLFGKARQAKSQTEIAQAEEDVKLRIIEAATENLGTATKEKFLEVLTRAKDTYMISLNETALLENGSITNANGLGSGDFYVTNVDKYPNIHVRVSSSLVIQTQIANTSNEIPLNSNVSDNSVSGVLTLDSVGKIPINVGFKPKYIVISHELIDTNDIPRWSIFYYNEKISTTKSYNVDRVNSVIQEYTMEGDNEVSEGTLFHICDVNNNGFVFYSIDEGNRKIYWTAFK